MIEEVREEFLTPFYLSGAEAPQTGSWSGDLWTLDLKPIRYGQ